jgi:hypothetical protein
VVVTIALLKKPSALFPIAVSIAALAFILVRGQMYESGADPEEGLHVSIFRFLLASQIPLILFFLWKWFPRKPNEALRVLALQLSAAVIAIFTSIWLSW